MKHAQQRLIRATLLAGLMGAGGFAMAQTSSMPAAPDPALGGQASTQSPTGVANPTQQPDGNAPVSLETVRAEARAHNRNNTNNLVPKGEASTVMNGQPNMVTAPTGEQSRWQVSQQARKVKPHFGQPGERPEVPTNPTEKTGTPK